MYFKIEEPILLMFWLQNRYKSRIFKQKTDRDPTRKVHQIVPVL